MPVIGLVEQILRLFNNMIESTPLELRYDQSRIHWAIWRPILMTFVTDPKIRKAIEDSNPFPEVKKQLGPGN